MQYPNILEILKNNAISQIEERKQLAGQAFQLSSAYDAAIADYFGASSNNKVHFGMVKIRTNRHISQAI